MRIFAKTDVEMDNVELNAKKLEQLASRLKAIAHPVRIAIIEMLSNDSRLSVTEIYQLLDIEQAAASHHLNIMKNKGILESRREGKKIFYSLQNESLSEIIQCVNKCKD
ncbi:MAG: winged helix-turn-helix transcriptional regulator [Bacteroidetes bacterium]|jgi:DNA-binding transcriptional ArsR family regulator|nr:winged helix-turn-helix transcriptional regulator [Bacteroidota bacterium]